MDKVAEDIGIDFIGGYGALVHKSAAPFELDFLDTVPEALASTKKVCSSVNVGSTKSGINMDAVGIIGDKIKRLAYLTRDNDSIGCTKFVAFCNAVEDNPFMAGAFNGTGEGDAVINVGVSGPGVVQYAISKAKGESIDKIAEIIKKTAFKITRVGQLVAQEAAKRLGAEFGIVDLSLAPTPKVGDSVAHILEEMGLSSVGAHGTTACLAILNDAVKKGGLMASSSVGGLSGAFIPVSEDIGMINAARRGSLSLEKLEAMTCVCSVGLDMIAVPGDTPASTISAIIADECAIGMVNNKTTAVRIIPVYGKGVGEEVSFGGLLGNAPVMPVRQESAEAFISRGGRIPEKPENADAAKSASVADKINAAADKIKLSNGAVHAITVFILCLLLGYFGIHRFIQGKIFTGFVWLFTGGLFFLGYIFDVALSASRMAAELRKNNNG